MPLGVFAVLVLALVVYVAVNMRDEPLQDDSDLALPPAPVVADKDNAWYWFNEATNLPRQNFSYSFRNAYCTGKPNATNEAQKTSLRRAGMRGYEGGTSNDIAYLDEIFATNAAFLACMERGAACEYYVLPRPLRMENSCPQTSLMVAGQLWQMRSVRCQRAGDWAGAFAAISNIVRVGHFLTSEGCSSVSCLIGVGLDMMAVGRLRDLICDPALPPDLLDVVQGLLPDSRSLLADYDLALRGDHALCVATIDEVFVHGDAALEQIRHSADWRYRLPMRYVLHPHATRNLSAIICRWRRGNVAVPCLLFKSIPDPLVPLLKERRYQVVLDGCGDVHLPVPALRPNAFGFVLLGLVSVEGPHQHVALARFVAGFDGRRVMIACLRYKRDTGAYPKALKDLVPKYLAAVPADPYDGEPMRYDAAAGKIWSRMFEAESKHRAAREKELTFQLPK